VIKVMVSGAIAEAVKRSLHDEDAPAGEEEGGGSPILPPIRPASQGEVNGWGMNGGDLEVRARLCERKSRSIGAHLSEER
jgi:hypothetical protein